MEVDKDDFKKFFEKIDKDGSGMLEKHEISMFLLNMKREKDPSQKELDLINEFLEMEGGQILNSVDRLRETYNTSIERIANNQSNLSQNDPNCKHLRSDTQTWMQEFKRKFRNALNDAGENEELTAEQLKNLEKKMLKYKNIFERPFYSENVYSEFNITGLRMFYQKAKSELHDIHKLFKIESLKDEISATTPPLNKRMQKPEIRIHFEELCYLSKLTNNEVK